MYNRGSSRLHRRGCNWTTIIQLKFSHSHKKILRKKTQWKSTANNSFNFLVVSCNLPCPDWHKKESQLSRTLANMFWQINREWVGRKEPLVQNRKLKHVVAVAVGEDIMPSWCDLELAQALRPCYSHSCGGLQIKRKLMIVCHVPPVWRNPAPCE